LGFSAITAANVPDYEERLEASLAHEDPLARLAMIRCPTLVVHGELDPIPVAFGRFLARVLSSLCFPTRAISRSSRIVTHSSERSGHSFRHSPPPDDGADPLVSAGDAPWPLPRRGQQSTRRPRLAARGYVASAPTNPTSRSLSPMWALLTRRADLRRFGRPSSSPTCRELIMASTSARVSLRIDVRGTASASEPDRATHAPTALG